VWLPGNTIFLGLMYGDGRKIRIKMQVLPEKHPVNIKMGHGSL
jgi:hypothetical protein